MNSCNSCLNDLIDFRSDLREAWLRQDACSTFLHSHARKLSRLRLLRQPPDESLICGFWTVGAT
ncbi:MAG: hypothetical protein DMG98_25775 [Acidobacteria bacterium]|nr:MAG: hypothetical protein DMG98_25775 [Acidobacteriota bacterium]